MKLKSYRKNYLHLSEDYINKLKDTIKDFRRKKGKRKIMTIYHPS